MSKLKNLTNCVPRRLRRELQHQQQLLLQRERRLLPLQLHRVRDCGGVEVDSRARRLEPVLLATLDRGTLGRAAW